MLRSACMCAAPCGRKKRPRSAGSIFPVGRGAQAELERRESAEAAVDDSRMVGRSGSEPPVNTTGSVPQHLCLFVCVSVYPERPGVQHPGGSVPGAGHICRGDLRGLPVPAGSDAPDPEQRMLRGPGRAPRPGCHLRVRVRPDLHIITNNNSRMSTF